VQRTIYKKRSSLASGKRTWLLPGLLLGFILLVGLLIYSLMLGAADITPATVFDALFRHDETSFNNTWSRNWSRSNETQVHHYRFSARVRVCIRERTGQRSKL
jgi:ABC-type Fe3+-siderophore transport system permease subunit